MDRRWQLVLDCLDTDQAPFSKGTLVAFRQRLIAGQMDRRFIERTIENLFDLRRCAVVHNLHVLARSQQMLAELQPAA